METAPIDIIDLTGDENDGSTSYTPIVISSTRQTKTIDLNLPPRGFKSIASRPDSASWYAALDDEIESLKKCEAFEVTHLDEAPTRRGRMLTCKINSVTHKVLPTHAVFAI